MIDMLQACFNWIMAGMNIYLNEDVFFYLYWEIKLPKPVNVQNAYTVMAMVAKQAQQKGGGGVIEQPSFSQTG